MAKRSGMAKGFNAKRAKSMGIDAVILLLGSALYAVSVNCFTAPNQIAPGGATGVATILNYLFQTPIGVMILAVNVPLFVWSVIQSGFPFLSKTLVATVLVSIAIDASAPFLPVYEGDKMLAAIFGGLLSGVGLGLIFMRGATTGGSDLAAKLISRHFRMLSVGKLILAIDFVVIAASALVFRNLESGLYAIISIYVSTHMIDTLLYGLGGGNGKLMFIMSSHSEEIAKAINQTLGRGVTLMRSKGNYSGWEGFTLMSAVRRQELYRVRDIVKKIDPKAFIVIGEAEQIVGEGFVPFDEE